MAVAQKYTFDTVFTPDGGMHRAGKNQRSHYSAAEVDAERASAFEEGRTIAVAGAETSAANTADALARAAAGIAQRLDQECAQLRAEAAALALAVARQAAGAALDAYGEERILAAVEDAMELLRHGPRLLVRVPTNSFNMLRPRLEAAAQQSAYPGALVVREDPNLNAGDVTLDWAEGAIALNREALFARIEEIMARRLDAAQEAAP